MMVLPPPPTTAWAHQTAAFEFVDQLWKNGRRGAMLAIVMGGGKSKIAIDLAESIQAPSILIIGPLRVVEVWRTQFLKFSTATYEFLALDLGTVEAKTQRARQLVTWGRERHQRIAIAINYESARMDPFASWALTVAWPLVILDEAHRISAPAGRTSRFCARLTLRSHRRLALTGTPMPHSPLNIWAQFRFLDPLHLDPTFSGFRARYAVLGGYYDREVVAWQNLSELEHRVGELTFRVDASVLDLPAELDQVLSTRLGPEGARVYSDMEQEMIAWLGENERITAANALTRLLRLQQITGGTLPDDRGTQHTIDHAKEELLADFLSDAHEPVVVFCIFKSDLQAIHRASTAAGVKSGELSGAHDDLALFQRGSEFDPSVLAVQIQAGGLGIDLTRARIAVYYSTGYSLANYLQSRARIYRPPQKRPCLFYHLQIHGSIDEDVLAAIERRQELVTSVLEKLKHKGATP